MASNKKAKLLSGAGEPDFKKTDLLSGAGEPDFKNMEIAILRLPHRKHHFSEFLDLQAAHGFYAELPQWKEGDKDYLGVNERLTVLLLGLERQKATCGLVVISTLDLLDLFKKISPKTLDVAGPTLKVMTKKWTSRIFEGNLGNYFRQIGN